LEGKAVEEKEKPEKLESSVLQEYEVHYTCSEIN
jgi:hypothetical protein